MKTCISIPTAELRRAMSTVKAASPSKSPKPVLLNVLLKDGRLTASDSELQITTRIGYDGDPLLLPHAKLSAILATANGEEMVIESNENRCTLTVGSGSWTLPTEPADEFPLWEPDELDEIAELSPQEFCLAIKSTSYATSEAGGRFVLSSVLAEVKDGRLAFVGSDGRRIAAYEIGVGSKDSFTLIPRRSADAMASLASQSEEMVTLEANQKEVVLTQGDTVVRSRIVGGSFPRWRACFPSRNVTPNTVLASELLSASKQAGIVTSETSKSVFYSFTEEGVFLTAKSQECGESRVVCPIESLGMAVKVNLNPSFVEDIASRMDSVVEIEASDPESAVVFRSGNAFALISPVVVT